MSTGPTDDNPATEVQFHDSSYVDTNLRLFRWRDELYRGATQLYADFYRKFLNSDVAQGLMKDGLLVRTEITEHRHSGFDLILKHKTLPVVTYPYEWSFDALKDAAQLTLEIQERLLRAGLRLHDPHPWNILFDGTRPVFVDIGAISDERDGRGAPALAFRSFYLNPLRLISVDQGRIARSLLASPDMQGVTDEEAFAVLEGLQGERFSRRLFAAARWALPPSARRAIKASFRTVGVMTPQSEIRNARAKLRGIDLHGDSRWSHYYGEGDFVQLDEADRTLKTDGVEKVLKRLRPRSVLDIGSNTGRFSFMAARHGARVVALDIDEICINRLYGEAKQNSLDIHPLVTNIAALSGGDGLWRRSFPPATARLPCELVMALALTHHLVFRVGLKFEQIADALADFAGRALLVEFVPREDPVVDHFLTRYSHVPDYRIRFYAWYGIDNFKKALMRHFARIETLPSHPEPRTLLLCER